MPARYVACIVCVSRLCVNLNCGHENVISDEPSVHFFKTKVAEGPKILMITDHNVILYCFILYLIILYHIS